MSASEPFVCHPTETKSRPQRFESGGPPGPLVVFLSVGWAVPPLTPKPTCPASAGLSFAAEGGRVGPYLCAKCKTIGPARRYRHLTSPYIAPAVGGPKPFGNQSIQRRSLPKRERRLAFLTLAGFGYRGRPICRRSIRGGDGARFNELPGPRAATKKPRQSGASLKGEVRARPAPRAKTREDKGGRVVPLPLTRVEKIGFAASRCPCGSPSALPCGCAELWSWPRKHPLRGF